MSSNKAALNELSDEQIDILKEVFLIFDQDGNETIHIRDLGKAMRYLGQHPTEAELDTIIAEIDADGNGVVEFPEFVDLMARRPWGDQGSKEELDEAFQVFKTGADDDYVLAGQVRSALTSIGEKLTDEEVDEMFKQLQLDGEGRLDYNQMVEMILETP